MSNASLPSGFLLAYDATVLLLAVRLTATNQCDEEGSEPVILQIPNYNRVLCCVRVAKT